MSTLSQTSVVMTGIGLVTPIGHGMAETWASLLEAARGIGPITQFDTTDHPVTIAGEVSDFDRVHGLIGRAPEDGSLHPLSLWRPQ